MAKPKRIYLAGPGTVYEVGYMIDQASTRFSLQSCSTVVCMRYKSTRIQDNEQPPPY